MFLPTHCIKYLRRLMNVAIPATALMSIPFSSCTNDLSNVIDNEGNGTGIHGMTAPEIHLLVRVPGFTRYSTRSDDGQLTFDIDRESRVSEMTVVLFHRDENGESSDVAGILKGHHIKRDELNTSVYTFKVSYYPSQEEEENAMYNAVVLANAEADTEAISPDMTAEEAYKALVREFNATDTEPFLAELPQNDSVALPMWGEVRGVSFPVEEDDEIPSYNTSLLRSVARVDVTVDSDEITPDKFQIESIHLVNGASAISLIPEKENLEELEETPGHWHALSPTLPENVAYRIRWDYDSVAIGNNISHTLYIPESDVVMDGIYPGECHTLRTAIVVGAHYEQSDSLHYYRMDFIDNETGELVNVRRNHLYTFHIEKVEREGAESVMDAYMDPVPVLGSSLIDWDLPHEALTYIGEDWISASEESVHLSGNEGAGAVIDVKSSLPLTTFRVRWTDSESQSYHTDSTESEEGVEASVYVNGDLAQVVVEVTKENPAGGKLRVCNLSLAVAAGLKITIPIIVHPLDDDNWEPTEPIEGEVDGVKKNNN